MVVVAGEMMAMMGADNALLLIEYIRVRMSEISTIAQLLCLCCPSKKMQNRNKYFAFRS